ncbi:hypothetical protein OQA88_8557 [Cercophora sp. LCS_1]
MEDAIPDVPGAYPGTPSDEAGPTPSPAPRHHQTSSHRHQHEHHEHDKLHKSNHPHGHRHTDSGVGLVDSQPIYPSAVDEAKPRAFSENTAAPTFLAYEPKRSASPQESNYTHASRIDGTEEPARKPVQEPVQAPATEEIDHADGKTGTKTKPGNTTPPYWGDLPKSMRGGIYNTVMGHGSPGDNHDQHHGLPQRSAPDRGHVTGPTDLLSGGVYNTVAGHGSQDEESRRHGASHRATEDPISQPGPDAPLAAPLPGINEEKPLDHVATETGRIDIARGFLPGTAVGDDVALATATAVTSQPERESHRSSAARGSRNELPTSGTDFTATHRAFSLSSSPDSTHRHSQEVPVRDEIRQNAESHSNRDAIAMAAGAGATGAALAASEQKGKRNKLQKQKEPSPSARSIQRSKDETMDKTDKIVTTSSPPRHSHDKETSRPERKSSDEGSPTSEKKHHGILGIFHRRKDSKGEKDHKQSDREVAESKSEGSSYRSSHKTEEAAVAAAAAGAGAHSLFRHHKDEEKPKDQRSSSEPTARRSEDTKRRSRRMSGNQNAAAAVAESAGAFGILYQKPQEKDINERQGRKSVDTEAPPAPPERSPKRRSITPPSSMAFAAETAHTAPSTAQGSRSYDAVPSHDNSAKYAGAGVAAGLGASLFANNGLQSQKEESNPSDLTQPQSGTTLFIYENPRDPPPTPANAAAAKSQVSPDRSPKALSPRTSEVVTDEPGSYNTLASGTASGIRGSTASGSDETGTRGSDAHNHLPSGTASGVKESMSSDAGAYSASKCEERTDDGESGLYNMLASGTPSGVKIGSKRSSVTEPASRTLSNHGDGQYNTLASGTSSGIDVEYQQREPQAAKHALVAAPMPSHHKESQPVGLTAFPPPEKAQKMSPDVLPDSYRAQSHATPATGPDADARAQRPQEVIMGPEVLPDSSRTQSHPVPSTDCAPVPARSHASAVDPALAAATGAWAGKTATGPGGAMDQSRVMHKCEYCGHDNDISSQFTKENMGKMTKKQGSMGNWWRDAWSSA